MISMKPSSRSRNRVKQKGRDERFEAISSVETWLNMWKPGERKRPAAASSSQEGKLAAAPPNAKARRKTKLSGATLGLRFMNRNQQHTTNEASKYAVSEKTSSNPRNGSADKDDEDTTMADVAQRGRQSVLETDAQNGTVSIDDLKATPNEMFGPTPVGRRSFGDFREPVDRIWKASLEASSEESSTKKMSDEELIRRYENHRRGRDGGF